MGFTRYQFPAVRAITEGLSINQNAIPHFNAKYVWFTPAGTRLFFKPVTFETEYHILPESNNRGARLRSKSLVKHHGLQLGKSYKLYRSGDWLVIKTDEPLS